MKKIKKYSYLIIFFTILLGLGLPKNIKAEAIESHSYKHLWEENTIINSFDKLEKSFYISENMNISDFTINLKTKASPTLIQDLSSISILVNKTPVYSLKIREIDESGLVSVKIPENLIRKGNNSISIEGFLKSSRDRCEFNPDINWLIIEKNSSINFKANRKDSKYIKDIFENTYYSDGLKGNVQIALADEILEENYSQLSSLSSLLGYVHKDKSLDLNIKPLKYSDLEESKRQTIIIGNAEQIKSFNKDLITDSGWEKAKENGYIGIRKIGKKTHFLLIASNDSQLKTLIGLLGNKTSLSQIKDQNYFLDKNKVFDKGPYKEKASLRDLGYESFSQSGSGIKEFNYFISLPANQMLGSDNNFVFHYNYSSLIKEDQAYLTVEINDDKLLTKKILESSSKDSLEFSIPPKYFDQTGFNISLKFNLAPEGENCLGEDYEDLWLGINAENSYLDLDLENRTNYSLVNAQGLLEDSHGRLDSSLIVDDYKNLSLSSLSNFSAYLGQVSQGVESLFIKKLDQVSEEKGVIIGLSSSPLIKSEKNNFQIKTSDQGELIDEDFFIQNTDSLGIISLSLDKDKIFIVANDKEQLNLSLDKFPRSLGPKISLILKDGKVIESFEDLEKIKFIEEDKNILGKEIIIALLILVSFILLVFFLYYKKIK